MAHHSLPQTQQALCSLIHPTPKMASLDRPTHFSIYNYLLHPPSLHACLLFKSSTDFWKRLVRQDFSTPAEFSLAMLDLMFIISTLNCFHQFTWNRE